MTLQRSEPAAEEIDLPGLVAQLRDLRAASQKRRYRGAAPDLPSREATIELADALVAALYPRHFGPLGLKLRDTDGFVAHQLADSLPALQTQVSLELKLAPQTGAEAFARAESLVKNFALALPHVRALLDSDIRAAFEGDPSAKSIDEVTFCFPGVYALIRHRLAHRLYTLGAPMLARIIAEEAHSRTGIDIHPGATIGEGFFIDHGTGVVIGETAIIGRRVRLYQAVTLGAKRFETGEGGELMKNYPRHPIVEDDVVIYAGATILGRITIGKGASIGGNVWLTHSVPAGANVSQSPVRQENFLNGGGI